MIGADDEDVPEEYLASMGPPWCSPRNSLNDRVGKIGEGRKVELTYLRDGKERKAEAEVKER